MAILNTWYTGLYYTGLSAVPVVEWPFWWKPSIVVDQVCQKIHGKSVIRRLANAMCTIRAVPNEQKKHDS